VLRVPIVNDSSSSQLREGILTVDIEIDGIHHKQEKKKRFCMLRDKYLEAQGVVIERIDASVLRRMEDKEVKDWIQERVAEAQKLHL
jgi:very-short-patch-repair endonuclease